MGVYLLRFHDLSENIRDRIITKVFEPRLVFPLFFNILSLCCQIHRDGISFRVLDIGFMIPMSRDGNVSDRHHHRDGLSLTILHSRRMIPILFYWLIILNQKHRDGFFF